MDESVLEERSSFKLLGLTFSSKLDWGSYIISIAKTAPKKTRTLFCSTKFLSLEVALYLYELTIRPCIEYCCHVWGGAPSCYLELVDKVQKWICRTVGSVLVILIDCMVFFSPFLDVTRMSMSTVSFLAQLESGILCL